MADNTNPINPSNVADAEEYLKNLLEIRDVSRDITSFTKELLKSTELNVIQQSALLSAHKSVSKAISDQSNNIFKVLDNEKSLKDIQKDIAKNKLLETRLTNELSGLVTKNIELERERQKALDDNNDNLFDSLSLQIQQIDKLTEAIAHQKEGIDEINKANELAAKIAKAADKKSGGFENLSKVVKSIPGLKGLSEPFEKAAKASRESALSGKDMLTNTLAGGKSLVSGLGSFLKGPIWLTLLVEVAKFFLDAMFEADKRVTDIAKNFSISKDNARATYQALIDSKSVLTSNLATTKNINEAFLELVNLSDFVTQASFKQLDTQIKLTKEIGIQAEDATQLQQLFVLNNNESDKGLNIVYDQIAAFANQNKVVADGRKIIAEVNKLSSLIKLNFKGSTSELVGAVLNAKKLGLNLDQVSKIGASLLDFESSISSQIEAELLTGRQINLEKARLFALNNDILGLTEEITKQGITQEKFAAMNAIQQESIAKSLGMSASELGDALYKQQLINKTGGANIKARREEIELLKAKGHLSEAQIKTQELAQLEQGLLTGKTLEQAQASLDAQTKFNTALERAKELFSDLVTGGALDKLSDIVIGLANALSKGGLRGLFSVGSETKKATSERQLSELEDIAKTNVDLSKELAQRNLSLQDPNKKPIFDSDQRNSINTLYDRYKSPDDQKIKGNDFTITTNPKDTLVMAGGTKLGGNDELIAAMNKQTAVLDQLLAKDTNFYIDYEKFQTAGSRRTYSI